MRIKSIQLSWFRGAAESVLLDTECKSVAIYGENGAGKSSFVDGVEYVLKDGRIGHLAHEYSGKHLENAVPNTHKPPDRHPELNITFQDGSQLTVEVGDNGLAKRSGAETIAMGAWDYQRTVLRQDEVASFIHDTKGGKYSALLPLLGLSSMEVAAENLRNLAKSIEQQAKLKDILASLKLVESQRASTFGLDDDEGVQARISALHASYRPGHAPSTDGVVLCEELENTLVQRISQFSVDQKRYVALKDVAELNIIRGISVVRGINGTLANAAEPLINERLEVLRSSGVFASKVRDQEQIHCPACGQQLLATTLHKHVDGERKRLEETIAVFDRLKAAIAALADDVRSLKTILNKSELKPWRLQASNQALADSFAYLDSIDPEVLRGSCGEEDLKTIQSRLQPLIDAAIGESRDAPSDVQQLSADRSVVMTGKAVFASTSQMADAARTTALVSFVRYLEEGVREELRLRAQRMIEQISGDIKAMWAVLHPDDSIEGVRLYVPKGADKAIDIGLQFHGVEQESPRLTLSEGYRNSLGLCIFLAMARREAASDRPLFLDDVIVSLDRNHRGMIVELLETHFSDRQVIVLTHDREWFTELRQQLASQQWGFKTLLPYKNPTIGIQLSQATATFDEARLQLTDRPDSAGNDARKIMDIQLAMIVERLQIRLQYRRGEKNDHRTAHEFLERLITDGKKAFQRRGDKDYSPFSEAVATLQQADQLLISWGNRASHGFDIVRSEARRLIETCEAAVACFKCSSCARHVWFASASGWVQCQCSQLRWKP